MVLSSIYSAFRPFGVTVKWTDSLTLLQTSPEALSCVLFTLWVSRATFRDGPNEQEEASASQEEGFGHAERQWFYTERCDKEEEKGATTCQGRAILVRLEWSISFIQDVLDQGWPRYGEFEWLRQPFFAAISTSATSHPPSRVMDEDYDEGVADALVVVLLSHWRLATRMRTPQHSATLPATNRRSVSSNGPSSISFGSNSLKSFLQ